MMFYKFCVLIITTQCVNLLNGAATNKSLEDLPIRYPGPTKDISNRYDIMEGIPDECKGKNYCTVKPLDYPQEAFDKLFKGSKTGKIPNLVIDSTIDNRQGDPEADDDCISKITYEPLYKVRSKRGNEWRVVVNSEQENYVQKVRLETCESKNKGCFRFFPKTPGYETFCKQKYNTWEIVVSDGKGGTETIETELPVCCSCHYKPTV